MRLRIVTPGTVGLLLVAAGLGACGGESAAPAAAERDASAPVAEADAPATAVDFVPAQLDDEGYVGAAACAECHPRNHETWSASYHRRMTQLASPEAVLAPFEGRTGFEGIADWKLEREGDEFYATPTSRDGTRSAERMRVAMTTGSHHYQVYWLENREHGKLLALPFAWHLGDRAWIPRRSLFLTPPHLQAAYEIGRWEAVCIKCHTTNGTPEHPPQDAPRVADFGIACEACHGPGGAHVTLHEQRAAESAADTVEDERIVNPAELPHRRSAMVCGQCHGIHPFASAAERERWRADGFAYRPGDDLEATRPLLRGRPADDPPELLAELPDGSLESLFWSDGEVRVSGREYNGLVESPCYQRGEMDCVSCHRLHRSPRDERPLATWAVDQLERGMDGNGACTQCHAQYADAERLAAHAHHGPESSGAQCMNCHMPYTTYGLTKGIRSHTITSPGVAATLATGRPNACNLCHLDRPLGWTADRLRDWYGQPRPDLPSVDEEVSAAVVAALSGDAGQRALAAWALGWAPARAVSGTGWMPYLVEGLLGDEYDAVARVALRAARLDPRLADLSLDFTRSLDERRDALLAGPVAGWRAAALPVPAERAAAVLVRPDGTLDGERVYALLQARDQRDVQLAE